MRIKLTLGYDGTNYCGWQVQPNGVTIQQILEDALFSLTGERVRITGSGRTDAGVHAIGQVAHFDTQNQSVPPNKFAKALNTFLPEDIRVFSSEQVGEDFHACTTAKRKTYRYSFYVAEVENPLKDRYAVRVDDGLNLQKMQECTSLFIGEHDFKGFCASGSGAKTTVREIYDLKINQEGQDLSLVVTGNGFLYNMVRIIAGTLIAVGKGDIEKDQILEMIESGNRPQKIKTLSPKGLQLVSVEY